MCLKCPLSVVPVVLCACIGVFYLSISVGRRITRSARGGAWDLALVQRYSNRACINKYSYSTYDWTFLCHRRGHYNTVVI